MTGFGGADLSLERYKRPLASRRRPLPSRPHRWDPHNPHAPSPSHSHARTTHTRRHAQTRRIAPDRRRHPARGARADRGAEHTQDRRSQGPAGAGEVRGGPGEEERQRRVQIRAHARRRAAVHLRHRGRTGRRRAARQPQRREARARRARRRADGRDPMRRAGRDVGEGTLPPRVRAVVLRRVDRRRAVLPHRGSTRAGKQRRQGTPRRRVGARRRGNKQDHRASRVATTRSRQAPEGRTRGRRQGGHHERVEATERRVRMGTRGLRVAANLFALDALETGG